MAKIYAQKGAFKKPDAVKVKQPEAKRKSGYLLKYKKFKVRITKVRVYMLFIVVCVAIIALLSAKTTGTLANNYFIEMDFDHNPSLTEVQTIVKDSGLSTTNIKIQEGNRAAIDLAGDVYTQTVLDKITDKAVLNKYLYKRVPIQEFETVRVKIILIALLLIVLSAVSIMIFFRKQSLDYRLKTIALVIIPATLFTLGAAAVGILVSLTGVLALDENLIEIFYALCLMVLLLSVYLAVSQDRDKYSELFFD